MVSIDKCPVFHHFSSICLTYCQDCWSNMAVETLYRYPSIQRKLLRLSACS
jgi:hypothetical protein